jgi:hypothetical protein
VRGIFIKIFVPYLTERMFYAIVIGNKSTQGGNIRMKTHLYRLVFTVLCLIVTHGEMRYGQGPSAQVHTHHS